VLLRFLHPWLSTLRFPASSFRRHRFASAGSLATASFGSTVSPPSSVGSPCGSPSSNGHFDTLPLPPLCFLGPKAVSAPRLRNIAAVAPSSCSAACAAGPSDDAGRRYPVRAPERRPEPVPWFPHRGGVSRSAVPTSRDACGLTSCSPETQSRQGTVPSGRSLPALNALGPKPFGTGCSIGAEGASVKLYFSTFDQQDMHTFINNVDNFFLPACAFKNRPKTKSLAIRGAKLLLPICMLHDRVFLRACTRQEVRQHEVSSR